MNGTRPPDAQPTDCDDCALSDSAGCCGAAHGAALLRSDRAVLALAGAVILVIVLAVLTVPSSRHPLVLAVALPTLLVAASVSVLGAFSLRRPGSTGDRSGARALRLLPVAVAGLLVSLGSGLVLAVIA